MRVPGTMAATNRTASRMKSADPRHRHRDVILDAGTAKLLRVGDVVPKSPEVLALGAAASRNAIPHQAGVEAVREKGLEFFVRGRLVPRRRDFQQHVPGRRLRQRISRLGQKLEHEG